MQTGTIVRFKAGSFPPNAFLEKVLAANPNGWGAAIVDEEDGNKLLKINHGDEIDIEFIQTTLKTFDKSDITFYFLSSEQAATTESTSPYILVEDSEGVPKLIAFIEGNFPGHAKEKSALPAEYHMVHEVLKDKFTSLYEMADGDLTKVMEAIKKPYFRKEMLLNAVSRGNITIVAANGESVSYVQGDTMAEFGWGWTSNSHGYEGEAVKKEEPPAKVKTAFEKIGKSTVRERASTATPAIAAAVEPPKTDTAVNAVKNHTVKKMKPPAHLSRKDKGNWYKHKIGYKPKGWERSVEINVFMAPDNKMMSWSEVKQLGVDVIGLVQLAKNPEREKDTETDNLPDTQMTNAEAGGEKKVAAEALPLMSPDTRKHIINLMKDAGVQKTISENAEMILNPEKVKQMESMFADFAKQLGDKTDITDFIKWSYEMRLDLGKTRPDGLAVMCQTFAQMLAKYMLKEGSDANLKTPVPEKKKPMFDKLSATG